MPLRLWSVKCHMIEQCSKSVAYLHHIATHGTPTFVMFRSRLSVRGSEVNRAASKIWGWRSGLRAQLTGPSISHHEFRNFVVVQNG